MVTDLVGIFQVRLVGVVRTFFNQTYSTEFLIYSQH